MKSTELLRVYLLDSAIPAKTLPEESQYPSVEWQFVLIMFLWLLALFILCNRYLIRDFIACNILGRHRWIAVGTKVPLNCSNRHLIARDIKCEVCGQERTFLLRSREWMIVPEIHERKG